MDTVDPGGTQVECDLESHQEHENTKGDSLLRCDIVNMTRHVHHHFDYKKDGHSRYVLSSYYKRKSFHGDENVHSF